MVLKTFAFHLLKSFCLWKEIGPIADYSIAGPLSKGSGCITELYINAPVMDALCCAQDPLPKLTGIPLGGRLGNEVFQDLNP